MNEIITHKSINQERSQLINRALVADLLRQEGSVPALRWHSCPA